MFEELKAEYDEAVKGEFLQDVPTVTYFSSAKPRESITVTLPDGSTKSATSWQTSPMDVAKELSKSLSERIVIAKVRLRVVIV